MVLNLHAPFRCSFASCLVAFSGALVCDTDACMPTSNSSAYNSRYALIHRHARLNHEQHTTPTTPPVGD